MGLLNKAAILAAEDLKTRRVTVPEWGGDVIVRTMTGTDRDALEASMIDGKGLGVRARVVALSVVDEDGNRLFTDEDVATLSKKSGAALERVAKAAMTLNRMSAADVADLEGNSGAGPSGASTSA